MPEMIHRAPDGAAILFVKIDYTRAFYQPAADAFTETARTRLYAAALDAYAACTDRRKRYRFPAWTAQFAACGTEEVILTIAVCGRVLRRERHIFAGDLLRGRERLRDIL